MQWYDMIVLLEVIGIKRKKTEYGSMEAI